METLPPELIRSIAWFLPLKTLLRFKISNKNINLILSDNYFWYRILYRNYGREIPVYSPLNHYCFDHYRTSISKSSGFLVIPYTSKSSNAEQILAIGIFLLSWIICSLILIYYFKWLFPTIFLTN